jgi:hypothetical protein
MYSKGKVPDEQGKTSDIVEGIVSRYISKSDDKATCTYIMRDKILKTESKMVNKWIKASQSTVSLHL